MATYYETQKDFERKVAAKLDKLPPRERQRCCDQMYGFLLGRLMEGSWWRDNKSTGAGHAESGA